MKTTVALVLAALTLQRAAVAADWSYCVAPADAKNRLYVSLPFPAIGPRAEARFDRTLARRRLPHDVVECPRADDEESAVVMRQHAIEVNRQWGRQVIDTHWRPRR
jgi:hypothetical protein